MHDIKPESPTSGRKKKEKERKQREGIIRTVRENSQSWNSWMFNLKGPAWWMKKVCVLSSEEQEKEGSGLASVCGEPSVGAVRLAMFGELSWVLFVEWNMIYFFVNKSFLYIILTQACVGGGGGAGVQKENVAGHFLPGKDKMLDSDSVRVFEGV